ncbi:unnamed protein product [Dovyalis caffra]|uniref:Uncharacterized protein n=1 Tax=Dovyalis caffra TaxID=77055 RepID=A0AAV1REM1_9ROSI|nr:unnamed protein product [Dovyalis caffra]
MSSTTSPKHAEQHHPKHHRNNWQSTKGYGQAVEYEKAPVCVRVGDNVVCSENVDEVAEEFIKLEHKRFELSKWMSMKAAR